MWTVNYLHDPFNGGVSKAYNTGFELAKEKRKRWIWLLDQDSTFVVNTILTFDNSIKEYPDKEIFIPSIKDEKSIVSPFRFWLGGGWRMSEINPGVYPLSQFFFINSGALVSVAAFQNAGRYCAELPLDFSDMDFIIRLRKNINQVVILPTLANHELSGNSNESKEKILIRFRSYLSAASVFRQKHKKFSRSIRLRVCLRAIKLSLKHSSLEFLKEYHSFNF
jgi:GT2 family glycosyltransferase